MTKHHRDITILVALGMVCMWMLGWLTRGGCP